MRPRWVALCLAALALFATGCSDLVDQDQVQIRSDETVRLQEGLSIGQTFVARHAGLTGIDIYLSPATRADGTVVLHLRESPIATTDVLTASVSVRPRMQEGFYHFSFSPLRNSHTDYYYAVLEYAGAERVEVATGSLDAYKDGTLYRDSEPQTAQAVFRLTYDRVLIVAALLLVGLEWMGYGLAAAGILFFGGYPLIRRWSRRANLDFTASLILALPSFLASWMVFLVWADVVGLRFTATRVRIMVGVSVLLGLVYFIRDRELWWRRSYWAGENLLATVALWAVVLLSIGLRLFVGRGMVMLPGSDTYHHTLIGQLFMEQGGIPQSYEPYAPLTSFSYHWGFHSIVALFRWLFGSGMLAATRTVALVLNGAIAAAVAIVTEQLTARRLPAVFAAGIVGVIAVSPFCLLQWGRFTQTTGLLFLAVGILALLAKPQHTGRLLPPLLIAGLLTCHYRVGFFLGLFGVVAGGAKILSHDGFDIRIGNWLLIGMASLAIVSPWLLNVARVQQDPYGLSIDYPVLEGYNSIDRLGQPVLSYITNWPLLIAAVLLSGAACLWGEKRLTAGIFVGWCLVLLAGAVLTPRVVGTSFWDLKSALLSLTVPLAVLSGMGVEAVWRRQWKGGTVAFQAGIVILTVSGIVVGLVHLPPLVYNGLFYLRPGDMVAMQWIKSNTRKDALFLVDTIQFSWSPGWLVGIDEGYWIPLLAHRATTVPPMIYPFEWKSPSGLFAGLDISEGFVSGEEDDASYVDRVVLKHPVTHVLSLVQHSPFTRRQGSQGTDLDVVYSQDRVRIFQVIR